MSISRPRHFNEIKSEGGGITSNWTKDGDHIHSSNIGNVGIGTSSPTSKLDIKDGVLKVKQETGRDNCLIINPNNHNNGVDIECFLASDHTTKKAICLNPYEGNVGIGTTTPTYPLEIHGSKTYANVGDNTIKWIELKTWSQIQGALLISGLGSNPTSNHPRSVMSVWAQYGYVTNSGYLQASDDRIKSFEIPIPVGLKEILQLEPKFYLKHPSVFVDADDETGSTLSVDEEGIFFEMIDGVKEPLRCEPEYGLISQAVEKIEGLEILVTDEINGIKNVNYIGLIPVLIKALQEQQIIIDTEKTKVATLETKTATLETTVADLVARIAALENA